MRCLITGIDDEGRSCLLEERDVELHPVDGVAGLATALLHRTTQSPPPPRPPALAHASGGRIAPGLVRMIVIDHRPYESHRADTPATVMHHSDSLDFVYVLQGSADYVLQDGAHRIGVGDCVVTPGVDHALKAGPEGCRMLAFSVGTPPPA